MRKACVECDTIILRSFSRWLTQGIAHIFCRALRNVPCPHTNGPIRHHDLRHFSRSRNAASSGNVIAIAYLRTYLPQRIQFPGTYRRAAVAWWPITPSIWRIAAFREFLQSMRRGAVLTY